jgi:hypothetical protein
VALIRNVGRGFQKRDDYEYRGRHHRLPQWK